MLSRAVAMLFLCVVALALVLPAVAGAHAAYKESDPADESSVDSAPGEIWAEFTEPPSEASYMEVYDPCGERVDGEDSRPDGYRLYVSMSGDRAGEYRVTFFVNSKVDNHNTRGEFTFTVTSGDDCPGEVETRRRGSGGTAPQERSGAQRPQGAGNAAPEGSADVGGEAGSPEGKGGRGDGSRTRPKEGAERVAPLAQPRSPHPGPDEPSTFSGIPWGAFFVGLGMAAVIGAAGGLIYAGIMGYARR